MYSKSFPKYSCDTASLGLCWFQPHLNRKTTGFREMYSLYWWIILVRITGRRSILIFVISRGRLYLSMVNQQFSFLDKGDFGMHYYLISIWCIFDIHLTGHTSGEYLQVSLLCLHLILVYLEESGATTFAAVGLYPGKTWISNLQAESSDYCFLI